MQGTQRCSPTAQDHGVRRIPDVCDRATFAWRLHQSVHQVRTSTPSRGAPITDGPVRTLKVGALLYIQEITVSPSNDTIMLAGIIAAAVGYAAGKVHVAWLRWRRAHHRRRAYLRLRYHVCTGCCCRR